MSTPLKQMNLNLLLSLDALLSEQNVTWAAKKIGVTQSAMSRNLASLRVLLHDELLVRVGNAMQPTPYALSIQAGLHRNLADLQRLVRTAGAFEPATATGTLRVAAPGHMAALIAPYLVDRIQKEAPGLRIRLEQLDAVRIATAIQEGVDIAIGPLLDLGRTVQGTLLFRDDFACLVRADHPDVPGDAIDLETYLNASHIIISPTGRGGTLVDKHLGGRSRRVLAEVQSFLLAPAIVANTSLVLTAPRSALVAVERQMAVKVVTAPFELPALKIAAYWGPSRTDDARVRWILDSVRNALRAQR
ncbi:MAG: LysR family transcriptional regulator [Rhodobacterales bacterium]|nr:LysR family transcriptional regulator [Rhodobacterales bacterium]